MNITHSNTSVILFAVLLLLPIVYVASYPLALRPIEIMWDPDIATADEDSRTEFLRRDAYYFDQDFPRSVSCQIGEVIYWPLNYLDRQWRPDYWTSELSREMDTFVAFVASLPTDAAGHKVLDLTADYSRHRSSLADWERFGERIYDLLFKLTLKSVLQLPIVRDYIMIPDF